MGGAHLNFEPGIAGLPPHLASLWGFRSGERGTHTSRTIMLDELSLLLAAVPGAAASRRDYTEAVLDGNCLGKRTAATRKLSLQELPRGPDHVSGRSRSVRGVKHRNGRGGWNSRENRPALQGRMTVPASGGASHEEPRRLPAGPFRDRAPEQRRRDRDRRPHRRRAPHPALRAHALRLEGQYRSGLVRILESCVRHQGRPEQPAAWIGGFFGSGKSHLAKMLRFL